MRRYIYTITALIHHAQFGGLAQKEIQDLSRLAFSTLNVVGVPETSAPNSFLYEDIHRAIAAIHRTEGDYWLSIWEHESAKRSSDFNNPHRMALLNLGTGIRWIRLGMLGKGIEIIGQSLKAGLDRDNDIRARINLAKALRLSGRSESAEDMIDKTLTETDLSEDVRAELEWERLLLQSAKTRSVRPIADAIRSRGAFAKRPPYVLEGFFWLSASSEIKFREQLPGVTALTRIRRSVDQADELFAEHALCLTEVYDADIPLGARLQKLGTTLSQASQLLSLDRELLLWAAATRWLMRIRNSDLMAITLNRYQQLSASATGGAATDTLQLFAENLKNTG